MKISQTSIPKPYLTLTLLCLGYFLDFYDLTIMSVNYTQLIQEQFYIMDVLETQKIYLLISNFQTAGIFVGAIFFGMLGDKIGRARTIRYSILLYSLATIAAVYTHSLYFFIFLRFIAYVGLACEFSTSTVLIIELFPVKPAAWGTALLYSFGVLGGISAIAIGSFSWKLMFLLGGFTGLALYMGRSKIRESEAYLYAKKDELNEKFGNFKLLLAHKIYGKKLIQYFLMIIPYFALITMMFVFPNYIIKEKTLPEATQILLFGFFIGNIISCFLSALSVQYINNERPYIFFLLVIFLILMPIFSIIPESHLFLYSIGLGLIGGGLPILLTQRLGRDLPVYIRSLACNTLIALGRLTGIGFNLLITYWLKNPTLLVQRAIVTIIFIFIVAAISFSRKI